MLDRLKLEPRRTAYLAIAQAAIVRGQIRIARSAAGKLAELARKNDGLALQARLYEAAAMLVTETYDDAVSELRAIDRRKLSRHDRSLLDAALDMAQALRTPPSPQEPQTAPPSVSDAQGKSVKSESMDQVIETAQKAIGSADDLLNGETR